MPRVLLALLSASLLAAPAAAAPTFTIRFGPDPSSLSTWSPASLGDVSNPDGTSSFVGSSPFGAGRFEASWSGTLTVNGNGVTLGHVPNGLGFDPMFIARVDGSDFMSLLAVGSSTTAAFGSNTTGADAFGLPARAAGRRCA